MVTRLLLAATAVLLVACSDNGAPSDVAPETVTLADIDRASPLTGSEAKVDSLLLRYKVGDTFQYRAEQISTGGVDTAFMEQRSKHVYTKRVRSVRGDGSFEIGMRFDSIAIDVKAVNKRTGQVLQEQRYSSADSTQRSDPNYAQFSALIGEEVTIILRPNATIQEIGGVSSIVNKIIGDQKVDPAVRAQYARQIELAAYASFVEQEYLRFPVGGVDSAGNWSTMNKAPILGELFTASSTATYHIDGVKKVKGRRIADVSAKLAGTVSVGNVPKASPMRITMGKSEISGNGRTVVDVDQGFTISKTTELSTDLQAVLKNSATGQQQNIAQRTTMRTTVQLLR
ncbi:MAG: hypothetical protein FGM24_03215 [Candidatus Kapabacteria bacterium]|nr:hypothetical protein [Candidatus Kapabacteria bacterium]